jgi:hypothetical protein
MVSDEEVFALLAEAEAGWAAIAAAHGVEVEVRTLPSKAAAGAADAGVPVPAPAAAPAAKAGSKGKGKRGKGGHKVDQHSAVPSWMDYAPIVPSPSAKPACTSSDAAAGAADPAALSAILGCLRYRRALCAALWLMSVKQMVRFGCCDGMCIFYQSFYRFRSLHCLHLHTVGPFVSLP